MITMMIMTLMILIISTALVLILNLISKKTCIDREKSSPFECGFDPKTQARLPFSLQSLLIAVIFLIFDVEITLLLPMIKTMMTSSMYSYTLSVLFFLLVLLIGLLHEWNQGALDWAK